MCAHVIAPVWLQDVACVCAHIWMTSLWLRGAACMCAHVWLPLCGCKTLCVCGHVWLPLCGCKTLHACVGTCGCPCVAAGVGGCARAAALAPALLLPRHQQHTDLAQVWAYKANASTCLGPGCAGGSAPPRLLRGECWPYVCACRCVCAYMRVRVYVCDKSVCASQLLNKGPMDVAATF